jgi:hypothetical protein
MAHFFAAASCHEQFTREIKILLSTIIEKFFLFSFSFSSRSEERIIKIYNDYNKKYMAVMGWWEWVAKIMFYANGIF